MSNEKLHYFLKLNPPRPNFMHDMNNEERETMQKHVEYWRTLLNSKIAIVYGPVFATEGGYGVGVVAVDSEEQLKTIINNDPANGLNKYQFHPMKAIYQHN